MYEEYTVMYSVYVVQSERTKKKGNKNRILVVTYHMCYSEMKCNVI